MRILRDMTTTNTDMTIVLATQHCTNLDEANLFVAYVLAHVGNVVAADVCVESDDDISNDCVSGGTREMREMLRDWLPVAWEDFCAGA